jgi:hypothetical protein
VECPWPWGADKCRSVHDVFLATCPHVACIQETKLVDISPAKFHNFLTTNLTGCSFLPSSGSRGGIGTAWDKTHFTLVSSQARTFTLMSILSVTTSDLTLTLTNVYGPSDHTLAPSFLAELKEIYVSILGAWLLLGDFNLIRSPSDKNISNFDATCANSFNQDIRNMSVKELPFLIGLTPGQTCEQTQY